MAAKKAAGAPPDAELAIEGSRTRQEVWKRVARIDSEELWSLAIRLIGATSNIVAGSSLQAIDAAVDELGVAGADIQKLVGKLLVGD